MKPARSLLFLVALFVAGVCLGPTHTMADELPKDTNKIESLTPEQARKLAKEFKGDTLYLNGLTTLDAATAKALAELKGEGLLLNGLTTLDAATAKALAVLKAKGLSLLGLTKLDADTAKALAEFKGQQLPLDGLTTLDADTAKALAGFAGEMLFLNGLTTLDADTAKALVEFKGIWLCLNGLTTLDAETAKALAECKCAVLRLTALTTLDADTAKALAEFKGSELYLTGLTTLDAATAKALAGFKGRRLYLTGLTPLDPDTAKALAGFQGKVHLPVKVVEAFVANHPLTPETAVAWATLLGGDLSHVTTLDPDTAKALAEFKGRVLVLSGLTTLDAATAKALAEFKGRVLVLSGLTTLDPDTAKALAGFQGKVDLPVKVVEAFVANHPLTPETAVAWATLLGGDLSHVTTLETPDSVAIAQALATREGPLSLPNLKKISPKTLTALIEKEDVKIPLIETLELIQEPDGSVTEDFVIPEWLEERERQQRAGQAAETPGKP